MEKRDKVLAVVAACLLTIGVILIVEGATLISTTINFGGQVPENPGMEISIDGHVYANSGTYDVDFTEDGLLIPGETYTLALRLTNTGNTVRAFDVIVDAVPTGTWVTADPESGSVAPFAYVDVTLTLTVPEEAEAGQYTFPVTITF